MRKNEAGLTILETGDVVRKGKGKVEYTVTWVPEEHLYGVVQIEVQSHNTGVLSRTNVETAVLVRDIRDSEDWKAARELEKIWGVGSGVEPTDTDDANEEEAPVVETSAYAKAVLFALNKLEKHVYAGTVRKNVKAKRRGLNARQKASRKTNR
jgi:hypothetical protein